MRVQRHTHTRTHVQSAHKRNGDSQAQEPGWERREKGFVKDLTTKNVRKKPTFTNLKKFFKHIELPAKLLDYFLRSNKSNINHCNSLQHTATYCNTLQHIATQEREREREIMLFIGKPIGRLIMISSAAQHTPSLKHNTSHSITEPPVFLCCSTTEWPIKIHPQGKDPTSGQKKFRPKTKVSLRTSHEIESVWDSWLQRRVAIKRLRTRSVAVRHWRDFGLKRLRTRSCHEWETLVSKFKS